MQLRLIDEPRGATRSPGLVHVPEQVNGSVGTTATSLADGDEQDFEVLLAYRRPEGSTV